jgi:hypothetical protein
MSDVLKNIHHFFYQQADTISAAADTTLTGTSAAIVTSAADTLRSQHEGAQTDSAAVVQPTQEAAAPPDTVVSKNAPAAEKDTVAALMPKPVVKKDTVKKEPVKAKVSQVVAKKMVVAKKKITASKKKSVTSNDTLKTVAKDTATSKDTGMFMHSTTTLPAPIPREAVSPFKAHNEWLAALLIFSVLLTGLLRITSIKYMSELFRAAFNSIAANKMYTSVNIRNSKPSFVLQLLFFFNSGIFVFETLMFYKKTIFDLSGFTLLLLIWGVLIGFGLIKSFLYLLTGFVFEQSAAAGEYLFNSNLLSKVFAIVLLPLISMIPFVNTWLVPNLIKLSVVIFIFLYILQLIRGAAIFLQNRFSLFYMFLYFCALEILPLVILYKILF